MARFTNNAWDNIYINHAINVCHKKGRRGIDILILRNFWPLNNKENKKILNWFLK